MSKVDLERPKMKAECFKCGYYDKSLGRKGYYKCRVPSSCPVAYDEWKGCFVKNDLGSVE